MGNTYKNKDTFKNSMWKLLMAIAMLPFTIIFESIKAIGTGTFAVPLANERIKTEKRRGITTVDASNRYNYND